MAHFIFSDSERIMIASCTLNVLRKYKNNRKDRSYFESLVNRVAARKDGRIEFTPKDRIYIEMFLKDGKQELINEKLNVRRPFLDFFKNKKIVKNVDLKVEMINRVLGKLEKGEGQR